MWASLEWLYPAHSTSSSLVRSPRTKHHNTDDRIEDRKRDSDSEINQGWHVIAFRVSFRDAFW
jgi:hypothetical protein